jgi:iron complex outermembrane receptor protein
MDNTFKQSRPFTGFETETVTAGYVLWNAGAGCDVVNKKAKTVFSIHLALINITDKTYQNHLSRLKYTAENMVTGRTGVFNAGRNFSLKINVPFNLANK